jgi:hypothetical protein
VGSLDKHLDDIDGKTTNLPADPASEGVVTGAIAGLNDISTGDAEAAAAAALAAYGAATAGDVAAVPADTDTVLTAAHGAGQWRKTRTFP